MELRADGICRGWEHHKGGDIRYFWSVRVTALHVLKNGGPHTVREFDGHQQSLAAAQTEALARVQVAFPGIKGITWHPNRG